MRVWVCYARVVCTCGCAALLRCVTAKDLQRNRSIVVVPRPNLPEGAGAAAGVPESDAGAGPLVAAPAACKLPLARNVPRAGVSICALPIAPLVAVVCTLARDVVSV